MTRSMGRSLTFVLLGFVAPTAVFVVGVSPALACSCAETDLVRSLPEADGAFVGTYVDRTEIGEGRVAFTFEVERVAKGDFGPSAIVRTSAYRASCGLEFYGDRRTGLLLRLADDGVWESDLCSMVEPSELEAFGGDEPNPEVAAVSAGWSTATKRIALATGLVALLALVFLPVARKAVRSASSPDRTDVA